MAGQGIDVGDAVLTFVADTTQLDTKFATIGQEAEAGLRPAADALDDVAGGFKDAGTAATAAVPPITEAAEATKVNMYEARGEVRLLGEEIGVRLPRHVGSFVASLPGVGEALQAAFSATAILFIAQALIQVTEKVSDWAGRLLFASDAVKENHAALVAANEEVYKSAQAYDAAKKALDDFGKSQLQLSQQGLANLNAELIQANKDLAAAQAEVAKGVQKTGEAFDEEGQSSAQATEQDEKNYQSAQNLVFVKQALVRALNEQIKAQEKTKVDPAQEAELRKQHDLEVKAYYEKVELAEKALAYAKQADKEELESKRKMYYEEIDLAEKSAKANAATDKAAHDEEVKAYYENIELQDKDLEIKKQVLKADEEATQKQIEFAKAHHRTTIELEKELQLLQKLEKEIGVETHVIDKAKSAMDEFRSTTVGAAQEMESAFSDAIAGVVKGNESFGKAMEKSTLQIIGKMAQQWAEYYFALGVANIFTDPDAAAGEIAGATALEALAGALSGLASGVNTGTGSSSTGVEGLSGSSNTSGAGQRGGTSVRGFADGGLIMQPTRALIGENGTEAVLPLTDPEAMARIGESIGAVVSRTGGGGGITVHVHGHVIGANDVAHLTAQISKRVRRGQAALTASNSLRVTKRSA